MQRSAGLLDPLSRAARPSTIPSIAASRRSALVVAAAGRYDDYDQDNRGGGYNRGRNAGGRREYDDQRSSGGRYERNERNERNDRNDRNDRRGGGYGGRRSSDFHSEEEPVGQRQGGGRGGYSRGGEGGQRGGYRQGGQRGPRSMDGSMDENQPPQRQLSPEAQRMNQAIETAASWRELQRVLESAGGGGEALDPFQLVAMLGRAVRLPAPGPNEPDNLADYQGFVASVYGWLLSKMDQARSGQLCRALMAVARLGLYNAELVDALLARTEKQLHSFLDEEVAMLVEAMATLGLVPSPTLADQLLRRTQGRLPNYRARSLAALITNLPRLGITLPPEWLAAYAETALANIREFNAGDYSSLVVGLASAGWRPSHPSQLQALVDRCYPLLQFELRVDTGRGTGMANPQQQQPAGDSQAAAPQQQPRPYGQRGNYQPRGPAEPQVVVNWLVNVSWALAQIVAGTGAQLPPQWANVVFDRLQYVRRFMRPAELSSLVSSCGYLGARPNDTTMASLLRDLQNMYTDATGDDLANFAMAMAQFQYKPADRFLDDFLITLRRKLPATSATGLSTIVAALPSISSGVRLNEVVAEAQARYDALVQQQQQQQEAAYAEYQQQQQQQPDEYQQDPNAAAEALTA